MRLNSDKVFETITLIFGVWILFLVLLIFYELLINSIAVFWRIGVKFFTTMYWEPIKGIYGALPFIYGTLFTASLALLVAYPISIGLAVFLTELAPRQISQVLSSLIELIAAIPSVIIGLWGIFILAPFIRIYLQPALKSLSFIPLFQGETQGLCYLNAILVLIFMITPIMTSIFTEAFKNVPTDLKEALYALGGTRYEVIKHVSIPHTRTALLAGTVLAYGRALGETLAVTMVIGNKPNITISLLNPGYTLAAVIANEFLEATDSLYISALIALGLILFVISLIVNLIGVLLLRRLSK